MRVFKRSYLNQRNKYGYRNKPTPAYEKVDEGGYNHWNEECSGDKCEGKYKIIIDDAYEGESTEIIEKCPCSCHRDWKCQKVTGKGFRCLNSNSNTNSEFCGRHGGKPIKKSRLIQHLKLSFTFDDVQLIKDKAVCGSTRNLPVKPYYAPPDFAETLKDMNCKKCYWFLFRNGFMNEEVHTELVEAGKLNERFNKWQRWRDIV